MYEIVDFFSQLSIPFRILKTSIVIEFFNDWMSEQSSE